MSTSRCSAASAQSHRRPAANLASWVDSSPNPFAVTPKTHYTTLGVALNTTQDQIKLVIGKLARRFHPGTVQGPIGQECFKNAVGLPEALIDPEPRKADGRPAFVAPHDLSMQHAFRAFFAKTAEHWRVGGEDVHGVVLIELIDAYRGVTRSLHLQIPAFDSHGSLVFSDRQIEVRVPKGVLDGQHLRLKGLGAGGKGGGPAGDLYLEVVFMRHPRFRLDVRDVYLDLPVAPWEVMLGATVVVSTPSGSALLTIPSGSVAQQKLQLKGMGLPGSRPGDLYAMLQVTLPPGDGVAARQAWRALARAFPDYRPRG